MENLIVSYFAICTNILCGNVTCKNRETAFSCTKYCYQLKVKQSLLIIVFHSVINQYYYTKRNPTAVNHANVTEGFLRGVFYIEWGTHRSRVRRVYSFLRDKEHGRPKTSTESLSTQLWASVLTEASLIYSLTNNENMRKINYKNVAKHKTVSKKLIK